MKVKKYIAIGMMVVLVFCLGGCVKIGKNNPSNKVVAYMNQKYPSDTFKCYGSLDPGFGQSTTVYYVNSENYSLPEGGNINNHICVTYYVNENGQEVYYDNYLAVKYYDQTEALYEEVLEEVFPGQEYKIIPEITGGSACRYTGSESMTFEEYISDSTNGIWMHCVFAEGSFDWENASEREAIEERMLNSLITRNMCVNGTVEMERDVGGWVDFNFNMESLGEFSDTSWHVGVTEIEDN